MLRKKLHIILIVIASCFCYSQEQNITLEEIWNGAFTTQRMEVLNSMSNGQQYSVLNFNRATRSTSVDVYDYQTQSKTSTLVDSKDFDDIQYFTNYDFSLDETKLILATEIEAVYRRSTLGIFFVYDTKTKTRTKISDYKIQEPTFSPDGLKVAYGYRNNIYIKNLETQQTKQITFDGEKNKIINGITDWVYEEEFAFVRAFEWNTEGTKIAYLKFDETEVPEFSMDVYGQDLYQTQQVFKYPKAGEKNADVSLHVYDLSSSKSNEV